MKDNNKKVWVGTGELTRDPEFLKLANEEFAEEKSVAELTADVAETGMTANRRDFLKYLGFSLGAATVAAGCDIPVKKAIPYIVKPDSIVPGVATYYASSYVQGGDYCAILVKTREGRPIKIEGNPSSGVTGGGTNARAQASVLSLYDTNRIQKPMIDGKPAAWANLDKAVAGKLASANNIRIVTNTVMSPMTRSAIGAFVAKYPSTEVVTYDAVSSSAMLEANMQCFNNNMIPDYKFAKADVIVSFGADFLGTWISPIEYSAAYAENRKIKSTKRPKMSRHIQVEGHMSLTGSNADNRILIKPSEQGAAIATLYNEVAALTGRAGVSVSSKFDNAKAKANLKKTAKELVAAKGRSLVVSGSNNVGEQILVNGINANLSNYGSTIDFGNASMQRQGSDKAIKKLTEEVKAGRVDALIVMGDANPAFDTVGAADFAEAMKKVGTTVFCGETLTETAVGCKYVAPVHHYLESWGDVEPKAGKYSLIQPTISPLFDTRQVEMSLLTWSGNAVTAEQPAMEYLKQTWQANQFAGSGFLGFQAFWDKVLHDGVYETSRSSGDFSFLADVNAAASKVSEPKPGEEIAFFETVNMGSGQFANNPWLQELPDPITRCVWGNYLAIPVSYDGGNSIDTYKNLNRTELRGEANKVDITVGGKEQTVTAVTQFGLAKDVFSLALGYGRDVAGLAGRKVGINVYPWLTYDGNGNVQYYATAESIEESAEFEKEMACVQYHHTMGVRKADETGEVINVDERTVMTIGSGFQGGLTDRTILRAATLKELPKFVDDLHHEREHHEHLNDQTLYPYEEFKADIYDQGHHWGMHVDLNACTGCAACTVACMAENNVPVVGKHEVFRHHEMTWLRIDRYFYGDFENPNVVYQPLMCQHCDNAPCENVCPVSATNHSNEGLNQMAYNRCIGTRYCANNCPFKVRRFNWLDYQSADLFPINEVDMNHHREGGEDGTAYYMTDNLTRMVLNPDVTVRSRGVMEKCSFCVQRLQEGKLTAKKEGRRLEDRDVKTACQTACPTGAITFGDDNNKNGELTKKKKSPLNYILLEETDVRSSVMYSAKIVNKDEEMV